MVCVNKFDINLDATRGIEKFSFEKGLPIVGRIPFDPIFIKSMVQGQTIFEYNTDSEAGRMVTQIWEKLSQIL